MNYAKYTEELREDITEIAIKIADEFEIAQHPRIRRLHHRDYIIRIEDHIYEMLENYTITRKE